MICWSNLERKGPFPREKISLGAQGYLSQRKDIPRDILPGEKISLGGAQGYLSQRKDILGGGRDILPGEKISLGGGQGYLTQRKISLGGPRDIFPREKKSLSRPRDILPAIGCPRGGCNIFF